MQLNLTASFFEYITCAWLRDNNQVFSSIATLRGYSAAAGSWELWSADFDDLGMWHTDAVDCI